MLQRAALCSVLVAACVSAPPNVEPCSTAEVSDEVRTRAVDRLDLLFVVDDSASMATEREHLLNEVPRIVYILMSGDRDGDGVRDFAPDTSIHMGVITSDLGGAASGAAGCAAGDDAVLVAAMADGVGCGPDRASGVFDFRPATDDPNVLATEVGCVAALGSGGCGVEQPLEATLRALSVPAPTYWTAEGYAPPTFADGSTGHGGESGANAGFLRPNSRLVVVLITNEDDCSVSDVGAELGGLSPAEADPSCAGAGGLLALDRFADGLLGLRAHPSLLTFIVVAGVPQSLVDSSASYDAILDAPEMHVAADPTSPGHLLASCTSPRGRTVTRTATPPRRLVELAQRLEQRGANTATLSICNDAITGVADVVIGQAPSIDTSGGCLPRPLEADEDGRVDCEVLLVLAPEESDYDVTHCSDIDGVEHVGDETTTFDGGLVADREICRVPGLRRADVGSAPGWFYDDGDARLGSSSMLPDGCAQRIGLSALTSVNGSDLRIRCREHVEGLPECSAP